MGERDTRNKVTTTPHDFNTVIPAADPQWADEAQWWYKSLMVSGQAKWYENSDWMTAYVAADLLSQMFICGYKPGLLAEWNNIASRLCVTEGDRRRVHLELVKTGVDPDDEAAEEDVKGWQGALSGEVVHE
jgi:hypothetical protein